ncbi:MAG: 4'-phosphopantetheinyl transferase superfamily protein, partial [Myxococcales bacterium]|jgi:4'-phosphopantetheinyl transferase|nr:4'-phosphopantetheinyl transferase superfamily protein [Myxococcales bacterium]
MTIGWMLLRASALPEGDDWLSAHERKVLAGLKFPKRRSDWRLGRFVAKQALASSTGIDRLDRVEIIADEDGAPDPFIDGKAIESSISISHREDAAACAIAPDARVGCDLEVVEQRSRRFVNDFFTDRERAAVQRTPSAHRDRHVALTWSAKESALKVLRVGLRRDTRRVEVEIEDPEATEENWHPLRVTVSPERRCFHGWWHQDEDLVLTVVCDVRGAETRPVTL